MVFAINDLAGNAAIIDGARYMILNPIFAPGNALLFEALGQRYRFELNDFGALQVTTDVSVNGEATPVTFTCAEGN